MRRRRTAEEVARLLREADGCDRAGAIDYAAFLGFFSAEPS